jgi:hypothetical protein
MANLDELRLKSCGKTTEGPSNITLEEIAGMLIEFSVANKR